MKACNKCPFRRTDPPNPLGGSTVETFIGQIGARMHIPCHQTIDYSDPGWRQNSSSPCIGAMQHRAARGLADRNRFPPSGEVMRTAAEFVARHKGISHEAARALMADGTYEASCIAQELSKISPEMILLDEILSGKKGVRYDYDDTRDGRVHTIYGERDELLFKLTESPDPATASEPRFTVTTRYGSRQIRSDQEFSTTTIEARVIEIVRRMTVIHSDIRSHRRRNA